MQGTQVGNYTAPNANVRREQCVLSVAGAAGVSGRFQHFQKIRLKAVHARVVTAGTSASPGHALTIKHGTTSIGLLAAGTIAAGGSIASVTGLDRAIASMDLLSLTNGTDATGVALVNYEYEVEQDAIFSA